MATFAQLLARQRGKQALQATLGRVELQSDVQKEQKDLEAARREYQAEVEKAEREMKKRAKKRGRRRLASQIIGTGVGLVTGQPFLGAGITGAGSAIGAGLVPEYEKYIEDLAPGGKFLSEARADFSADIASTNQFIKDAAKGQNLLDLTNALQDAYTSFTISKTFGKDFDKFIGKRAEAAKGIGPEGKPKVTFLERTLGDIFNKGKDFEFFKEGTITGRIADAAKVRTRTRELERLKSLDALFGGFTETSNFTPALQTELKKLQEKNEGTLGIKTLFGF